MCIASRDLRSVVVEGRFALDDAGLLGESVEDRVGEHRGRIDHEPGQPVVEVDQPHPAVVCAAADSFLRRVGVELRCDRLRRGPQPRRRLGEGGVQHELLEPCSGLIIGDRGAGIEDRGHVRLVDPTVFPRRQCGREPRHHGRGIAHPSLHRAIGEPHRRAQLGGDLPQRQVVIGRTPRRPPLRGALHDEVHGARQQPCLRGLQPGDLSLRVDDLRHQRVERRPRRRTVAADHVPHTDSPNGAEPTKAPPSGSREVGTCACSEIQTST